MKAPVLLLTCLLLIVSAIQPVAAAERAPFGIGFALGEPSFLSLKYQKFAIGAGWSGWASTLHVHADYWFLNDPIGSDGFKWYLGLGAKLRLLGQGQNSWNSPFGIGVRVPVGLQYFIKSDVELFGELAPGLAIFPFGPWADAGAGIRFYL